VLSVTHNIQSEVEQHLVRINADYRILVNVLPTNGPGQESITSIKQAVSYVKDVKAISDDLSRKGIEEFYLFLDCSFSVAVFVGQYQTAMCPVQVFDYAVPGYTESFRLEKAKIQSLLIK
jgi:hypothetical protein